MSAFSVAVTGAGGFIGSHVVERLLERRVALSLLSGPADRSEFPAAVSRVFCGDIGDSALLAELVAGARVVVHLAGPASVRLSFGDPVGFVRTHVAGTTALLEACLRARIERFVYVSSAEVYGISALEALAEDEPPRPVSPYAAAKLGAEALVRVFAEQGLQSVVLRPFSVYGAGQSTHGVLHSIVAQACAGSRIELQSLSGVRDFVHVSDVAGAIARACEVELKANCRVFNVGTGHATSIRELVELVLSATARDLPIVESRAGHARSTDIARLVADTSRSRVELGWTPAMGLAAGVRDLLRANRKRS